MSSLTLTYSDWAFIKRLMQPMSFSLEGLKGQCTMAENSLKEATLTLRAAEDQFQIAEYPFIQCKKECEQALLLLANLTAEEIPQFEKDYKKCEEKCEAARVRMIAALRVLKCSQENEDAAKEFLGVMQKALAEVSEKDSPLQTPAGFAAAAIASGPEGAGREMKLLPYILPRDIVFSIGDRYGQRHEATFTLLDGVPCFEYRGALYNNPTALVAAVFQGHAVPTDPWEIMRVAHYEEFKNMKLSDVYELCAAGARQIMKEES